MWTGKPFFNFPAALFKVVKFPKNPTQLNLPIETVQRFIAANFPTHNLSKINIWDKHFNPPEMPQSYRRTRFN